MPGHRDDRRARDEQLRAAAHDHREVRADHAGGAEAGDRAERGRDDRHARQVLHDQVEARQRRHVGEAHLLERLDRPAAAGAVDQPHERDAQVVREPLGVDGLLPDRRVGGAAAHGEVVALHDGAAAVEAALADDRVGGQEVRQVALAVVAGATGQRPGLVEACRGRTAARSARARSGGPRRADARRAPLRPCGGPAPHGGGAPRARAPSSRLWTLRGERLVGGALAQLPDLVALLLRARRTGGAAPPRRAARPRR